MSNKCNYCGSCEHSGIFCDVENKLAPFFKKEVGNKMEEYVINNICCQYCNKYSLQLLGDFTPSLDIYCENCNAIYEVKSKCLSVKDLPKNIYCNSGNYYELNKNIELGLNLIIVVYGVYRKTKDIFIRNIYYISNQLLKNNDSILIRKKNNSTLSEIILHNVDIFKKINTTQKNLSFKHVYDNLLHTL